MSSLRPHRAGSGATPGWAPAGRRVSWHHDASDDDPDQQRRGGRRPGGLGL